jgi:hypothetical protein
MVATSVKEALHAQAFVQGTVMVHLSVVISGGSPSQPAMTPPLVSSLGSTAHKETLMLQLFRKYSMLVVLLTEAALLVLWSTFFCVLHFFLLFYSFFDDTFRQTCC